MWGLAWGGRCTGGGVGGVGGRLPFTNFAESGLAKKCKKIVHPIVH